MDALADVTALEARIGRPLTADEVARAGALLEDASALVRSYTGQTFTRTNDETITARAQQGEIRLPQRPVIDVTEVVAIGAAWGTGPSGCRLAVGWPGHSPHLHRQPDHQSAGAVARGEHRLVPGHVSGDVQPWRHSSAAGRDCCSGPHGAENPDRANRCLGGVVGETIGPYSYRTDGSGVGTAVVMTDEDRQMLALAGYRRKAGMSMVRFQ